MVLPTPTKRGNRWNKKQKTKQKTGETLTNVYGNPSTFAVKSIRMSFCIIYLASPRNFHIYDDPAQASRLELIQQSLNITQKLFPTTDIFLFHEDYTEEEFKTLPGIKEFIQVDFSGFESFRNPTLRRPYGYLMMCRFFSGVVQSYPQLQNYSHYMRLDDDSFFLEPYLNETNVKDLLKHDYVYRSSFGDLQDQTSLYEFTLSFLKKEGYEHTIPTLEKELHKKYFLKNGKYTGLAPYNNFHIASQRLWQNPLIQRFLQSVEEEKGILRYGWMDANIHAMIIYILTLYCGMKIHHVGWFGYRHNRHVSRNDSTAVDYVESLPFGL